MTVLKYNNDVYFCEVTIGKEDLVIQVRITDKRSGQSHTNKTNITEEQLSCIENDISFTLKLKNFEGTWLLVGFHWLNNEITLQLFDKNNYEILACKLNQIPALKNEK
tara:strand:+ start:569 stop:892 length:324 start_codon:yes stop_codon:yes gene_type:complete